MNKPFSFRGGPGAALHERSNSWIDRYSEKHKPRRVVNFPEGVEPPKKVRIYARGDGYLLQFWDKDRKRTLNERIHGDLVTAIFQAREIDQRLLNFNRSGRTGTYRHAELASRYLLELEKRCAAGEIDPATVVRYGSVVRHHYLPYCECMAGRQYQTINKVDRDFQLGFASYLRSTPITPNGHDNAAKVPMKVSGQLFARSVVKAMYSWAADPQRGNMLPDGFLNPFLGHARSSTAVAVDRIQSPNITVAMAIKLIGICDRFQLPIFASLMMYGLRPGELGLLFRKDVDANWIKVQCHPELDYFTKGRQNKKFPAIIGVLPELLESSAMDDQGTGLVFRNRRALLTAPHGFEQIVNRFHEHAGRKKMLTVQQKRQLRDRLLRAEGQLSYEHVKREFHQLSRMLNWPLHATLKDFRHLFSTCLEQAGVPEYFKKYLMGHSFGRTPLVAYTHISQDKLRDHFLRAVKAEMTDIVDAIKQRHRQLRQQENS